MALHMEGWLQKAVQLFNYRGGSQVNTVEEFQHGLIEQNLTFAKRISRRFYAQRSEMGVEFQEFYSSALLGLCDAAQRFDQERGDNFQTFSYFRIRGAMYDLLRHGGWNTYGAMPWIKDEVDEAASPQKPEPLPEGKKKAKKKKTFVAGDIRNLAQALSVVEDLNLVLWVEKDADPERIELTYANHFNPEAEAERRSMLAFIKEMLSFLDEMERKVLEFYYFEGLTFDEMRPHFNGVSRSWLSRVHARALKQLRDFVDEESDKCAIKVRNFEGVSAK